MRINCTLDILMGNRSSGIIKCRKVLKSMHHVSVHLEKVRKHKQYYTSFSQAFVNFQFQIRKQPKAPLAKIFTRKILFES